MTQKSLFNMSNEQKPSLFRVYRGWNPTRLCGDYFRSHEIGGETILPCASAVVVLWFILVLFTYMYTINVGLSGQVKQYFAYEAQHQHSVFDMTGGFKCILCSPLLGEMIQFDKHIF